MTESGKDTWVSYGIAMDSVVVGAGCSASEINPNVERCRRFLVGGDSTVGTKADLIRIPDHRCSTELGVSSAVRQINGGLTEGVEEGWWFGGCGGWGA